MQAEMVTIIGAGPAGIAAAVQLRRYGLVPMLVEKNEIGGLLRNAHRVENYPGFPAGISGVRLASLFRRQIGNQVAWDEVTKVDLQGDGFLVEARKRTWRSQIVVVASGTRPRQFTDFEIPPGATDKVFYEIIPVRHAKRKEIVVVGAGDAAFDYALSLAQGNRVVLLNRGKTVKCLPLLEARVRASPQITLCENAPISKMTCISRHQMLLECAGPARLTLRAHYVLFAIGREAQLDFVPDSLKKRAREMEEQGFFFVGDVKNGAFRQTAIAVGDGVMVAMKIRKKMEES